MQVVILAAGLGTRLRPLTYEIPKPMVPIKGKPFLEYQLELVKRNGFREIVLCVSHLGKVIKDYFGSGEKLGLNIVYSTEDKPLGTGSTLKNAESLLEDEFLLLYGDSFLDIDYQDLIRHFHKEGKLGMTVVFTNQPKIVANNVEINSKNEIVSYNKKEEGAANCVEAGVHVFKKDILNFIPAGVALSMEEEFFPVLIKKKELIAYPCNQRFYDIGTFERIKEFNELKL